MSERSASLLTKSQREGLIEGLGSSSADRKLRQRMQTRVRDSTKDLQLLFTQLEDDDIADTFQADLSPVEEHIERLDHTWELMYKISDRMRQIRGIDNIEILVKEYEETLSALRSVEEDLEEPSNKSYDRVDPSTPQERTEKLEARISEFEGELEYRQEDLEYSAKEIQEVITDIREPVEQIIDNLEPMVFSSPQLRLFLGDDYIKFSNILKNVIETHKELEEKSNNALSYFETIEDAFAGRVHPRNVPIQLEPGLSNSVSELNDVIENYQNNYSRRHRHYLSDREQETLRDAYRILRLRYEQQSFSPDLRDDVVKALGFYLRVINVAEASLESILEDAITQTIGKYQETQVIDSVSVNIETVDREYALKQGKEKLGKARLSNAELRAIAESETGALANLDGLDRYAIEDQILERLLADPDLLEIGFEFTDIEPSIEYQNLSVQVDLLGKSSDGVSTLVDIETNPSTDLSNEIERMRILVEAASESDTKARGIIVLPESIMERDITQTEVDDPIIDVCVI